MNESIYNDEHEAFRALYRRFLDDEVLPHYAEWETIGHVPRDLHEAHRVVVGAAVNLDKIGH